MAALNPTPTVQACGFMMSSSDINNESDDDDSGKQTWLESDDDDSCNSQPRLRRPRPSTPFEPPTSPAAATVGAQHTDITYDLTDPDRASHTLVEPERSVFDSAYSAGKLAAEPPSAKLASEDKEALNNEIDRRDLERDMRDNDAAQQEIMAELAKPWLKDFPHDCIPDDNYQLFDLEDQRNGVENDLNCLMSDEALDGTPLDPNVDREDLYQALNTRYNNLNRAMYTVFANVLQADALSYTARLSRKRRASAEPPTSPEEIPEEPDPCPYGHIRDEPAAPKTSPVFDPLPEPQPGISAPHAGADGIGLAVQPEMGVHHNALYITDQSKT
jgi:hypothetical protein